MSIELLERPTILAGGAPPGRPMEQGGDEADSGHGTEAPEEEEDGDEASPS